jgi:hypothetical protein
VQNSHFAVSTNPSSITARSHISRSTKNNSQKVGVFFEAEKCGAKTPHPPCISPRFDHQNTTSKHAIFPQPPSKPQQNATFFPIHHSRKKITHNKKIHQLFLKFILP